MEDKLFDLIEKMYTEFKEFKQEMVEFKEEMIGFKQEVIDFKQEMTGFKQEVRGRLTKIELNQEKMEDKLIEAFEAIESLAEVNERQHQEILRELKGDIEIIELAVKRVAK